MFVVLEPVLTPALVVATCETEGPCAVPVADAPVVLVVPVVEPELAVPTSETPPEEAPFPPAAVPPY